MEQIKAAIRQLIEVSEAEMDGFLKDCYVKNFKRKTFLSEAGKTPDVVFFINKGIVRVMMLDTEGVEHTLHFALENQFIGDYASFIQQKTAFQSLQAIEEVEAVVIPRLAIEWGYQQMQQGDKFGRLIAEYYFIYLDNRLQNLYANDPATRYANIETIFPNIHNRAPQHMIASYLGITPVHLSRLKKELFSKA
jgi:CRP-like cAMP-binding protein